MSEPKDKTLYQKAKDKYSSMKHSAYKSGLIEDWQTSDGKKEYSKKADVFRPTKKVSFDTPTTYKELTKKQVRDAMIEKAKTGRVKKYDK